MSEEPLQQGAIPEWLQAVLIGMLFALGVFAAISLVPFNVEARAFLIGASTTLLGVISTLAAQAFSKAR